MTTAHVTILMNMADDKVLMMSIVDREMLRLNVPIGLVAVNTTASIYSNRITQSSCKVWGPLVS